MSADVGMSASKPGSKAASREGSNQPSTPRDATFAASSQQSIPSTEGPASPVDPSASFKDEMNDDRISSSQPQVIPSSLTPPPSSQVQQTNGTAGMPLGYVNSQRSNLCSPPTTTAITNIRRDGSTGASDFMAPSSEQISHAPVEDLRAMVQSCLAENARLKMETAHHKLQYNMLSVQAQDDAMRAAVEHDMTRAEVQALRSAEDTRQARRDLSSAAEAVQAKYLQLRVFYEAAMEDNDGLSKRLKAAKKIIQQKEDENIGLVDERDMLLTRIRENREHFYMLTSPGGAFHGALTPKISTVGTPQAHRTTPRQTPKSSHRESRTDNDAHRGGFAVLLQALNHDNNSAPSTPITSSRPAPRIPPKHTRGAQSLSSLPTTPGVRPRGQNSGLLPSVDLVPRTEPAQRYGKNRSVPETPTSKRRRTSRESTISADDDNEQLARAALQKAAAASKSLMSQGSRNSAGKETDGEEVHESQASQAASDMLRRDPLESFEVASSTGGSRDGTPAPAEKSAKLQSKLFAGLNKAGVGAEKRKLSGPQEGDESGRDMFGSPAKKTRVGRDGYQRVGLGIQYGRES